MWFDRGPCQPEHGARTFVFTAVYAGDGGYVAYVEELAGIHTEGGDLDEAEQNLRGAAELYLESIRRLDREPYGTAHRRAEADHRQDRTVPLPDTPATEAKRERVPAGGDVQYVFDVVYVAAEDGGVLAYVEIRDTCAIGATIAEARRNLNQAIALTLARNRRLTHATLGRARFAR